MPPNPRPRATLPAPLAAEVETLAAAERRSTSNMIAVLVAEAVNARKVAPPPNQPTIPTPTAK